MSFDRYVSILCSFFTLVVVAIVALASPATGYEIDIYAAYPWYLWIFVVGVYLLGVTLLLRHVMWMQNRRWCLVGLTSIALVNVIVLSLPVLRGYYFHGWTDSAQLYGLIKDVYLYGNIGGPAGATSTLTHAAIQNVYPGFSILIVAVGSVSGLDLRLVSVLAPAAMFLFYQLSVFLLARGLSRSHYAALLASVFAFPMLFLWLQSMVTPTILLFFYAPFVIFLAIKAEEDYRRTLLAVVVLVSLPLLHPIDTLSLVVAVICFRIVQRRYKKQQTSAGLILVLTVAWISWIASLGAFEGGLHRFYLWLIGVAAFSSEASSFFLIADRAHASIFDLIDLALKLFGGEALYFLLSGIVLVGMLGRKHKISAKLLFPALLFVVFLILTPLAMMVPIIGTFRRFLFYAVLGSTLLNAFYVHDFCSRSQQKKALAVLLIALVCASMTLGVFTVYRSPFIRAWNEQVDSAEITGMTWFLVHNAGQGEFNKPLILIDQARVMQYALSSIVLGTRATPNNIRWGTSDANAAPDHFGYEDNEHYGDSYRQDRYFLSNAVDPIALPRTAPEYKDYWRWSDEDWIRLQNDSSVLRLSSNGEFTVYYVIGTQT